MNEQGNLRPLYIFDLDGTVALINHRRDILAEKDDKLRWRRFYAACDKDTPNAPIIAVMKALAITGAEIRFFSGRSSEVRNKTISWLAEHTPFMTHEIDDMLTMRDEGDHTPDDVLKKQWLDALHYDDRNRIVCIFDDRDRVVKMWRDAGLTCLQVAPGDF